MSFEHEEREPVDYGLRMAALARSFHCLAEADGVLPWDPERFVRWMHSGAPGHGARCAGQFVLSVWNPYTSRPLRLTAARPNTSEIDSG